MKKFFAGLLSFLIGASCIFAQTNMSNEMYDLAKMKEGLRNRRVSSYDRTGNNRDHLKPGETAVLADIKGAGVINHIWITMSPGPRELSRNDIILRMYWDGSDKPSVVSPIGPFFGQGWNEQYNYASFVLSSGPNGGTGLCSYFAMPFAQGARIEIENQTDVNIGRTHVYRFFIQDPVFSEKGLKATIEHGHNNCLTLDLATVAYWYQDKATVVPAIPDKAGRKLKPMIDNVMMHKWRHEWRKNKGNKADLWGDETE